MVRTDQTNDQVPRHGQPQVGGVIALGSKEGDHHQELYHKGADGGKDGTTLCL